MKKHLRILYGADDRHELVTDTLNVCHMFFDTVRVVQCGPIELNENLKKIPSSVQIEHFPNFHGDIGMCRKHFLYDVDDGDWVLYLDSDERPTQNLLNNLDNVIHECESSGRDFCRIPFSCHEYSEELKNWYDEMLDNWHKVPKTRSEVGSKDTIMPPAVDRFVKKTRYTKSLNLYGGHGGLYNLIEENWGWTQHSINHFKRLLTITQSAVTSIYFNPCINTSWKGSEKDVFNLEQVKLLRKFQKETGVVTQNDLCRKLHIEKDEKFKIRFKELCNLPSFQKNEDSLTFSCFPMWANDFDLSWETPSFRGICSKNCCRYEK